MHFLIHGAKFLFIISELDGRFHALLEGTSKSERISTLQNGSLKIADIKKEDEGIYECLVTNEVGSPLKKSAVIRVIGEKKMNIIKV